MDILTLQGFFTCRGGNPAEEKTIEILPCQCQSGNKTPRTSRNRQDSLELFTATKRYGGSKQVQLLLHIP